MLCCTLTSTRLQRPSPSLWKFPSGARTVRGRTPAMLCSRVRILAAVVRTRPDVLDPDRSPAGVFAQRVSPASARFDTRRSPRGDRRRLFRRPRLRSLPHVGVGPQIRRRTVGPRALLADDAIRQFRILLALLGLVRRERPPRREIHRMVVGLTPRHAVQGRPSRHQPLTTNHCP